MQTGLWVAAALAAVGAVAAAAFLAGRAHAAGTDLHTRLDPSRDRPTDVDTRTVEGIR